MPNERDYAPRDLVDARFEAMQHLVENSVEQLTAATNGRLQTVNDKMDDMRACVQRVESALLGVDDRGGLFEKVGKMEEKLDTLMADYHERQGLQRFSAPMWAILGGLIVAVGDHLLGRFF